MPKAALRPPPALPIWLLGLLAVQSVSCSYVPRDEFEAYWRIASEKQYLAETNHDKQIVDLVKKIDQLKYYEKYIEQIRKDKYCVNEPNAIHAEKILAICQATECKSDIYQDVLDKLIPKTQHYVVAHLDFLQPASRLPIDRVSQIMQLMTKGIRPWSKLIIIAMPSSKNDNITSGILSETTRSTMKWLKEKAPELEMMEPTQFHQAALPCNARVEKHIQKFMSEKTTKPMQGEPSNRAHVILWIMVLDC